jgi:tetratricopeptide (TPR) repeat protein
MRNIKKCILLFLLLSSSNQLFAQYKNVFKLPFPQQYIAIDKIIDTLVIKESKFAKKKLELLELQARKTKSELILLNFKRSEIRYRYIRTIGNEKRPILNKLILDTERLIARIDEKKYPEIAALLHFQIGNSLDYQKYNYKEQFKHYLKAYELFKDIPLKQFPYRYYSQYAIALAYYRFEEYEKAIKLSNEIEYLFPEKDFNSILTVNLLGLSYLKINKYDKAIHSFRWILKNREYALNPRAWKGISLCNLADVYVEVGKKKIAIRCLDQGIPILKEEAVHENLASSAIVLARIYIEQNNSIEAKRNIDIAIEANTKERTITNSYLINKVLFDYYQLKKDPKLALYYLQLSTLYKDSIDINTSITKRFKAEINFEKEKHLLVVEQIKTKIRNQRIFVFILVIFTVLVLIIIYVFFDRRRLKHKLEQQELLLTNKKISSELEQANLRLDEFIQSLMLKETGNLVSELVNDYNIYSEVDWIEFKNLFDQAHPRYLQSIKEKLPNISPAEIRFIAVYKLNFNTNEMAQVLNISPDAVRKSKKRLSLKIAQDLDQTFDQFINSVQ